MSYSYSTQLQDEDIEVIFSSCEPEPETIDCPGHGGDVIIEKINYKNVDIFKFIPEEDLEMLTKKIYTDLYGDWVMGRKPKRRYTEEP